MGKEQTAEWYDALYVAASSYKGEPETCGWYPLWRYGLNWLRDVSASRCVDLGCGPGHFAQLVVGDPALASLGYVGYDFSRTAIALAKQRVPNSRCLFVAADLRSKSWTADVTHGAAVVAFEVLEHVAADIDLVTAIPGGTPVLVTVPNANDPSHVRVFHTEQQLARRYAPLLGECRTAQLTRRHFVLTGVRFT